MARVSRRPVDCSSSPRAAAHAAAKQRRPRVPGRQPHVDARKAPAAAQPFLCLCDVGQHQAIKAGVGVLRDGHERGAVVYAADQNIELAPGRTPARAAAAALITTAPGSVNQVRSGATPLPMSSTASLGMRARLAARLELGARERVYAQELERAVGDRDIPRHRCIHGLRRRAGACPCGALLQGLVDTRRAGRICWVAGH